MLVVWPNVSVTLTSIRAICVTHLWHGRVVWDRQGSSVVLADFTTHDRFAATTRAFRQVSCCVWWCISVYRCVLRCKAVYRGTSWFRWKHIACSKSKSSSYIITIKKPIETLLELGQEPKENHRRIKREPRENQSIYHPKSIFCHQLEKFFRKSLFSFPNYR